jgi:hypothetical protein
VTTKRLAIWGGTFAVALLCALTPTDTPAVEAQSAEVAPAPHLTSETVDLGGGWGQTLWRDAEGNAYDLGAVFRLPGGAGSAVWVGVGLGAGVGVPAMIVDGARRYGLDPQRMLRVAWCESKYDPGAVGDGGRSVGVYQFQADLWGETPQGRAGMDRRNAAANIEGAMWAWSHGLRRRWSCQG